MSKIILDLCGGSGSWSLPYKLAGYDVRVVTLPGQDVRNYKIPVGVYGVLAAPPCTEFSKANYRVKKDKRNFKAGMEIVKACLNIIWEIQSRGAPLKFWALENPTGYLYNFLGQPSFYFQPWQFGETDFRSTKRTGLWGYFNPPIQTVKYRSVNIVHDYKRIRKIPLFQFKEQRDNLSYGPNSPAKRAETSSYFAKAFFESNK